MTYIWKKISSNPIPLKRDPVQKQGFWEFLIIRGWDLSGHQDFHIKLSLKEFLVSLVM
jgi:hypothetical protein